MPPLDEAEAAILAAGSGAPTGGHAVAQDAGRAVLTAWLARSLGPSALAKVLQALEEAGLADPATLAEADPAELAGAIRQGGVTLAPRRLRPLQTLARWLAERGEGLDGLPTSQLRDELLGLNGIGPASADAVLLHGLGRPVYPVDRATYRILARHGWIDPAADYDEARAVVESLAPDDPATLARIGLGLERIGRDACKPTVARCERCPLRPYLPEGGPYAADDPAAEGEC